ncbi:MULTISPECIES: hypothetical protein [Streptomyces]|uniref:Uncharacterized protein n=2 Tax=Streptomyces TaxID=1883 RepID=A0ABV9J3Z8_9ACTN
MSDEAQEARRTVAYRLSAYDGLPRSVRVSAAAALEALDDGLDAERARAAAKEHLRRLFGSADRVAPRAVLDAMFISVALIR